MTSKSKQTPQRDSTQHKLCQRAHIVVQEKEIRQKTQVCECHNESKRSDTSGSASQQGKFALDYHRGNCAEPERLQGQTL